MSERSSFNGDEPCIQWGCWLASFQPVVDPLAASGWGEHTLMNSTADSSLCRFRAVLFFVVTVPACKCTRIASSPPPAISCLAQIATSMHLEPATDLFAVRDHLVQRRLIPLCFDQRVHLFTVATVVNRGWSSAECVTVYCLRRLTHLGTHLLLRKLEEIACGRLIWCHGRDLHHSSIYTAADHVMTHSMCNPNSIQTAQPCS